MRIVGIDLSLTGTGLAEITLEIGALDDLALPATKVVTSQPTKDSTLVDDFNRQTAITVPVLAWALGTETLMGNGFDYPNRADLVVIEALFNSKTSAGMLIERAGLWWRIVGSLICYGIPIVVVNQAQGKKFLTGNGGSDKGGMTLAAARLYPQWTPSTVKNTNDEADALALASIGVCLMASVEDWPVPETDYRHKIVDDLSTKQLRREKAA